MLLIRKASDKDFQLIDVEEVCERFGVPLDKLKENPELLINEDRISDRLGQSRELSAPAGNSKPSSFVFTWKNIKYELKYAKFVNEVPTQTGENRKEYEPRKVVFKGVVQFYEIDDIDLMVYLYLYPKCGNSPFKSARTIHDWYFKDLEAEGQAEMDKFNELSEAISEINSLDGDALRVVAKALNITYQPFTKDIQIRAELSKRAQLDPYAFNKALNSNVTRFKGIVLMSVDMGVFELKPNGQYSSWYWGKGENNGRKVVDVISDKENANDVLFTHIQSNMSEYYVTILNTIKHMNADAKSDDFLENQEKIDLKDVFGSKDSTSKQPEIPAGGSEFGGGTDEIDINTDVDHELDLDDENIDLDDNGEDGSDDEIEQDVEGNSNDGPDTEGGDLSWITKSDKRGVPKVGNKTKAK